MSDEEMTGLIQMRVDLSVRDKMQDLMRDTDLSTTKLHKDLDVIKATNATHEKEHADSLKAIYLQL